MLCISRLTDDTYSQKFGNGHHKFYIELRCNLRCIPGSDVCSKCNDKSDTCKVQTSRKFNHGKVNEPIPDNSRIYGGKWYLECVSKYGPPSKDAIEMANRYQREARENLDLDSCSSSSSSSCSASASAFTLSTCPSTTSLSTLIPSGESVKKSRNTTPTSDSKEGKPKSVKKSKKPIIYQQPPQMIHKEVTLPTHIETIIEELDVDDYEIEYVKLSVIEIDKKSYFIDSKKGKLYKKIKDKEIGPYVGRLNKETNIIVSDIPDSDDED
jgi:hypothetical protein